MPAIATARQGMEPDDRVTELSAPGGRGRSAGGGYHGTRRAAIKPGALWLARAFGAAEARAVAAAYREKLGGGDAAARRILADLARYCRAGRMSFVAGDPHQTAFNEGARDAYLHIAEMIGLEPGEVVEPLRPPVSDET